MMQWRPKAVFNEAQRPGAPATHERSDGAERHIFNEAQRPGASATHERSDGAERRSGATHERSDQSQHDELCEVSMISYVHVIGEGIRKRHECNV